MVNQPFPSLFLSVFVLIEYRDYSGRFYFDSLVHDDVQLKAIIDLVGAEKVICGSDYPFPLGM